MSGPNAEPRRGARRGRDHPRTRAFAPVDYAGVGCEMDRRRLARAHGLTVIEDAAQGYGRPTRADRSGTADLACFSFHETKNVMCGEGGALVVNRPEWCRAGGGHSGEGHEPQQVLPRAGRQVHVDGPRLLVCRERHRAAFLWAQLEHAAEITDRRDRLWDTYHAALEDSRRTARIRRPVVPDHCCITHTCTTCCCPRTPIATVHRPAGRAGRQRRLPLRAVALVPRRVALRADRTAPSP